MIFYKRVVILVAPRILALRIYTRAMELVGVRIPLPSVKFLRQLRETGGRKETSVTSTEGTVNFSEGNRCRREVVSSKRGSKHLGFI